MLQDQFQTKFADITLTLAVYNFSIKYVVLAYNYADIPVASISQTELTLLDRFVLFGSELVDGAA